MEIDESGKEHMHRFVCQGSFAQGGKQGATPC